MCVNTPLHTTPPLLPLAGFCIGAIVAFLLNMIVPTEADPADVASIGTDVSEHRLPGHKADIEDQAVSGWWECL